jgi:hypothetical protein
MGTIARVKQGDYGTALVVDLYYRDDDYDITDDVTVDTDVVFIMSPQGSTDPPTLNREAATVTAVDTDLKTVTVQYTWQNGDTDTVGVYDAEFEFTLTGGPATAPTHNYLTVVVQDDLG